ncbi:MAG: DUF1998 domain-containing protein, partial [Deltaproteobacteria bacterium]|nr:DUF1998 domain-containing protein [Deltaproteobacteria bacterium]
PANASARLFAHALKQGQKTIVFTQARKATELIHTWAMRMIPAYRDRISSYRAGFLPEERREIERGMASGKLLGVISTSALEMGIDIGTLDVCILVGYPGTVARTWQRGGRVGRSDRESAILMVASPDALDQYFVRHPESFFGRSVESAVVDPNNEQVLAAHLPCAAAELPLSAGDLFVGLPGVDKIIGELEEQGRLLRTADGEEWFASSRNPHSEVNIRSLGTGYSIMEPSSKRPIGSVDGVRAFKECHPGAVYLHMARQYVVESLDLARKNILVKRVDESYYTRIRNEKETEILSVDRSRPVMNFIARLGRLKVMERVTDYEKRRIYTNDLMGVFPLDLPPQTFETVGMWFEIDPLIKTWIEKQGLHFMGGIHAGEHAAISMFPMFALCDRNDIGGRAYVAHHQVKKSAVFIYDGYPGGIGLARRGFEIIDQLLTRTLELIEECDCETGCPSCIHSPKCGSGNKPLDKAAAVKTLQVLTGRVTLEEIVQEMEQAKKGQAVSKSIDVPQVESESGPPAPRVLYFDLETQRLAQEVGGWGNTHLMRLAVGVVYDSLANDFFCFTEDQAPALIDKLKSADLVVGFNVKKFDYGVLKAYTDMDLTKLPTLDMLEHVHQTVGFRLSLDHLAQETLGRGKTGVGLESVTWFKQGLIDKVIDYCREDVRITRDLFLFGLEHGHVLFKNKQGRQVRIPVKWRLPELKQK